MGITLRSEKGSALTIQELDNNFRHFTGSHAVTGSLVVSGSLVISGSLSATEGLSATGSLITASAVDNTITFTKGNGTTFDVTIATGSGGGGGGSIDTGSFYVSSSVSQNTITFTQGDGTTESVTIATGSSSTIDTGSFAVTSSNHFTGSQFFSGSLIPEALDSQNGIYDLGSTTNPWRDLYLTTASLKFITDGEVVSTVTGEPNAIRVGNVLITTASFSFVDDDGNIINNIAELQYSGSTPVSSSFSDTGSLVISGSVNNNTISLIYGNGDTLPLTVDTGSLPNGVISGSSQLPSGIISSSAQLPSGIISSSAQLPSGIVSSSAQLPSGIVSSSAQLPSGIISGSTQLEDLGVILSSGGDTSITGSLIVSGGDFITNGLTFPSTDGTVNQVISTDGNGNLTFINMESGSIPSGTISSSAQITSLGFISSSAGGNTEFSGSTSFEGDTSFTGSTVVSGSLTVIDNQGFRVEGNTVLTGSNLFEGSTTITGSNLVVDTTSLTVTGESSFKNDVDITGSLEVTQGITGSLQGTASISLDSVLFDGKDSATFATTGSNDFKASQYISGSLVLAPSTDPGTGSINQTYLFTSASNFGGDECDFYYRNKGVLWDQEWFEQGVNSGLIYGGVVTFQGSTLYISPGGGLVVNHNANTSSVQPAVPTQVKWGPITASVTYLTSSQYSHIFIDENGDLQQQVENFTPEQYLEKIPLGTIGHLNKATIDSFGEEKQTVYASHEQSSQFIRAFGPLKQQGLNLSDSGSSLGFNVGSGTSFKLGGFYASFPNNPSLCDTPALESTGKIVRVYQSGSDFVGDINGGSFYNTIDPTKYDDGSGTLVTISGSTTTIQRVFLGPTSERFYVYYGQDTYDSISTALNNLNTEPFVESLTTSKSLTFIGYIVAQANATDLSNVSEANIVNGGLFRNTAGSSGGGTSTISNLGDITDVNISTPSTGQYLKYNAGVWENANIQYSEVNSIPSGIISSSVQLESLGVTLASGSSTTFDNDVIISGSDLTVTGSVSVKGPLLSPVVSVTPSFSPTGWTITIDPSQGNFFEATLQQSSPNEIIITNVNAEPGQTINIKLTQNATSAGTITWSSNVKFADGADQDASTGLGDIDVWSLVTWDGTDYYATGLKNFS